MESSRAEILPETLEDILFYREKRWEYAKPRFRYQNLPDSECLSYELMNWENFGLYRQLFENDPSPFVETQLKVREEIEEYVVMLLESYRYSFKRGACDWFLKRREDGAYVGVLHLYDLNHEFWDGKHFPPSFGYAIAEPFRRQGYAFEAAQHLLALIPPIFGRYEVTADPRVDNLASQVLLQKLGFEEKRKSSNGRHVLFYKQLVHPLPKITVEEAIREADCDDE